MLVQCSNGNHMVNEAFANSALHSHASTPVFAIAHVSQLSPIHLFYF